MGIGGGLAFVSVTVAATSTAGPEEAGLASGLINTAQQVGGSLGLAIVVAAATARTEDAPASGERLQEVALNEGYQLAMLIAAAVALLGALASTILVKGRTPQPERQPQQPLPV